MALFSSAGSASGGSGLANALGIVSDGGEDPEGERNKYISAVARLQKGFEGGSNDDISDADDSTPAPEPASAPSLDGSTTSKYRSILQRLKGRVTRGEFKPESLESRPSHQEHSSAEVERYVSALRKLHSRFQAGDKPAAPAPRDLNVPRPPKKSRRSREFLKKRIFISFTADEVVDLFRLHAAGGETMEEFAELKQLLDDHDQ